MIMQIIFLPLDLLVFLRDIFNLLLLFKTIASLHLLLILFRLEILIILYILFLLVNWASLRVISGRLLYLHFFIFSSSYSYSAHYFLFLLCFFLLVTLVDRNIDLPNFIDKLIHAY